MPSLQEMLVSYAVKIDESGVSRLHSLLDQNRRKAADTAAAFATLESGIVKLGKVLEQFTRRYPNFGLSGLSSNLVHSIASLFEGGARKAEGVASDTGLSSSLVHSIASLFEGGARRVEGVASDTGLSSNLVHSIASLFEGGARRAEGVSSDTGQRTRELSRFASVLSESIRSSVSTVANRPNTYIAGASGSGSFALNADTSPVQEAIDDLSRFIESKAPTMRMKGDASGLITAASNAAGRVKSILSEVKVDIGGSDPGSSSGSGHSSGPGFSSPSATVMQFSSVGGRFDSPTTTQVAEDGDTEYIIPVRKEKKAIPLIMQMMGDLSFSAYQSVLSQLGVHQPQVETYIGSPSGAERFSPAKTRGAGSNFSLAKTAEAELREAVTGISAIPSLSGFASGLSIQNHYDISAPCTIQVHSTGTDAKQVGEAAYNAAERQLLKSIRGVFQ